MARHCFVCKTELTEKNAYARSNGYLVSVCKDCNRFIPFKKKWSEMPKHRIDEKLRIMEKQKDILEEILANK